MFTCIDWEQMRCKDKAAARSTAADADHCLAHRHKTFEPTKLRSDAGEARAHLINLSATGALVRMVDPPKRGSAVSINLGHVSADAEAVWTSGPRFGVAFRRRLADATIDILLRA